MSLHPIWDGWNHSRRSEIAEKMNTEVAAHEESSGGGGERLRIVAKNYENWLGRTVPPPPVITLEANILPGEYWTHHYSTFAMLNAS